MEELRKETIGCVRSCLISMKGSCELRELAKDYQSLCGHPIPYQRLGHANLEEFLRSEPTLSVQRLSSGQVLVDAKLNNLSSDIAAMVAKQKTAKKRKPFQSKFKYSSGNSYRDVNNDGSRRWRPKCVLASRPPPQPLHYVHAARITQNNQFAMTPRKTNGAAGSNYNSYVKPPQSAQVSPPPPQSQYSNKENKPRNLNMNSFTMQNSNSRPPHVQQAQAAPLVETPQRPLATQVKYKAFESDVVHSISSAGTNRSQVLARVNKPPAAMGSASASTSTETARVQHSSQQQQPLCQAYANWPRVEGEFSEKSDRFFISGDAGKDLWNFTRFRRIDEPKVTVHERHLLKRRLQYDCVIKVDGQSYSSYPNDFHDKQSAIVHASQVALTKLIEKHGWTRQQALPVTQNADLIVERVPPLVQRHFNGIWSWQVEADYKDQFHEALPADWLTTVDRSPVVAVEQFADKFVLRYCNPEDKGKAMAALSCDISIPTSLAKFDANGFMTAKITCLVSAGEIWCRQIGTPETDDFETMSEQMNSHYTESYDAGTAEPAKTIVQGGYYLAWNHSWYRVRVLDTVDDKGEVQCLFVDRGDDLFVPRENIYDLLPQYARSHAQAFICRLYGLEDLYEISFESEHLLALEGADVYLEFIETEADDGKILAVVMYDTTTNAPLNAELTSLISIDSATPALEVGAPMNVQVSHIGCKGAFYVQLHSHGFTKLETLLAALRQQFKPKLPPPVITRANSEGKLFWAKLADDDRYHRVKIIDAPANFLYAQVFYVDIGKTVVVKMADVCLYALEDIDSVLSRYPEQAVLVKLHLDTEPEDLTAKMHEMIPKNVEVLLRLVKKAPDAPTVKIFVRHPNIGLVSVNDSLSMEKFNSVGKLTPPDSPHNVPSTGFLQGPRLPKSNEFYEVRVPFAVNPWNFFVQPLKSRSALDSLMVRLQAIFAQKEDVEPVGLKDIKAGNIYAAKYSDNAWYRVCVLKIIYPSAIIVFYVDYGYYSNLNHQELFALDADMLELPHQAIKAKLAGIKPTQEKWSVEDCKYFQKLVDRREYVSIMVSVESDELYPCDNVLKLKLIDTTSQQDVNIGDLLIQKKIAIHD